MMEKEVKRVRIVTCPRLHTKGLCKLGAVLRSRPTCHGIRRTVIDIARESLVFFFFRVILRLNPCRTGLLQLLDLVHITLPYRTHTPNPHHVHCLMDSLIPCYLYPLSPLTSP